MQHLSNPKKTNVYLDDIDQDRIEEIKKAIGTSKNAPAIRYAIRNVDLPRRKKAALPR